MPVSKLIGLFLLSVAVSCTAGQEQPSKTIKHVPMKFVSPASGKQMFESYCASCHGADGKGSGPAASALKVPPADLTTLAQKNGGNFPSMKVSSTLRGEADLPAHGSKEMPVWGPLFRSVSGGHESEVQQRIANLTKYIEGLQAK